MSDRKPPPKPADKVVSRRDEELTEAQKRWEREHGMSAPGAGTAAPPPKAALRPDRLNHRDDALAEQADDDAPPLELAGAPRQRQGAVFEDMRPPLISRLLRVVAPLAAIAAAGLFFATAFHDAARKDARIVKVPAAPGKAEPPRSTMFVLDVRSTPSATVSIDGVESGRTPALLNTSCNLGDLVEIELAAEGHKTFRTTLKCLPGRTSKLDMALPRAD